MQSIRRGGRYFRVYAPEWHDPLDTSYARASRVNRWNPPDVFGALYLNATLAVAAANARSRHVTRAIGLFDLKRERRPWLLAVTVPQSKVLDVVTDAGLVTLQLPRRYPFGVPVERCWTIARRAYAEASLAGIACRSAAECTPTYWIGEELAWFDRSPQLRECDPRRPFEAWYPDAVP